jgi:hypothetical protein
MYESLYFLTRATCMHLSISFSFPSSLPVMWAKPACGFLEPNQLVDSLFLLDCMGAIPCYVWNRCLGLYGSLFYNIVHGLNFVPYISWSSTVPSICLNCLVKSVSYSNAIAPLTYTLKLSPLLLKGRDGGDPTNHGHASCIRANHDGRTMAGGLPPN